MCNCKNIIPQSAECYRNMITVEIPDHMESYRAARVRGGLTGQVSIDPCIFEEIKDLWSKGIITYGSCCGHNITESMVNVANEDVQAMLNMDYEWNHPDPRRRDTFKLKSA